MSLKKSIIIQFFRYLWIAISLFLIFFILSQAIYTKRTLEYYLDFSKPLSRDIRGWYPEQRLTNVSISAVSGAFDVIAEPIYMKIYTPIRFESMTIKGGIQSHGLEDIKLGLKQKDGSWQWQEIDINKDNFNISFDLENAQILNNQLEIILSIPELELPKRVSLINNWQIILNR